MKKRILFMINSLRGGGAEKVLVNLVNGLDCNKYDVTVLSLFGEGVNRQYLHANIHFKRRFTKAPKGFVHWSKVFTPALLHRWLVKSNYDVEISYLQGVTTRIVAGAPKRVHTISWFHNFEPLSVFRNEREMLKLLSGYDKVVCVSKDIENRIIDATNGRINNTCVVYNTQDVSSILKNAKEPIPEKPSTDNIPTLVAVGTLYEAKGYMRLLKIALRLKEEGYHFRLWFVGDGPQREEMQSFITAYSFNEVVLFGFDRNPYKYISVADLLVCSSYTEGFSGVVSEATILGVPTLTTRCPGMDEILGENNEYGIIVENSDIALYEGLKSVLSNPDLLVEYKKKVQERKGFFDPRQSIKSAENLIDCL